MSNDSVLRERRKALGLSQATVGKLIGVSQQHVDRFEKGYPVPLNKIAALAEVLKIDKTVLLQEALTPAHSAGISDVVKNIADKVLPSILTTAMIDIVEVTACCGDGEDVFSEKRCGKISMPLEEFKSITNTTPGNIKLIKASGDSMDPTIKDGDMVWIDMSNNFISSDGVYLLRMPTGLAIKRVQSGLSNLTVKSDNPKYSDITAEVGEIKVIGKVIYIWNGRKV